jgi:hypothetical protein
MAEAVGPEPTAPTEDEWAEALDALIQAHPMMRVAEVIYTIEPLIERVRAAERARTARTVKVGMRLMADWNDDLEREFDLLVARSHTKEPE